MFKIHSNHLSIYSDQSDVLIKIMPCFTIHLLLIHDSGEEILGNAH